MRADALRPAVLRIELLHVLLVVGLWVALLPMRVVEPRALVIGALFMGVNFLLLSCGIHWVLTPFAGKGRVKTGIFLLVLKMALFLGLISVLLLRVRVDPLSFALGFSSLLVAIVLDRLWAFSRIGG
ncbi:MAG: hypothetical protein HYY45_03065 [Deltaproteobacteria bacterium]|nr:hypothetical protein [Deltaproteobacteria bacterium]